MSRRRMVPSGLETVARWILAGLGALSLSSCYVTVQGSRYLALRARAVRAERVLADPDSSRDSKDLVLRAEAVRSFATSVLGLADTRSYRALVELDSDRLATVVSACDPVSFDRHLWKYPLVGALPYKGFFEPGEAEREAERLKAKGLDTLVRPVDAFSTLGWFADPLFSTFARYDDGELAELIIHELAHATVFVKKAEQFNEEFATFVGRRGARLYLARAYGPDSPELEALDASRADSEAFAAFLRETARRLETVYSSGGSREEILARKAELITARAREYRDAAPTLLRGEAYRSFPMERVNNAYLDLYRLYEGEPELYDEYLETVCGGDLEVFIRKLVDLARLGGDPKKRMKDVLAGDR